MRALSPQAKLDEPRASCDDTFLMHSAPMTWNEDTSQWLSFANVQLGLARLCGSDSAAAAAALRAASDVRHSRNARRVPEAHETFAGSCARCCLTLSAEMTNVASNGGLHEHRRVLKDHPRLLMFCGASSASKAGHLAPGTSEVRLPLGDGRVNP
ncbi:unnamed protein product [Polarella glacialis]|uniref:Uncharacterized protein n=1 Tax=Polarella glacialis TaxID=89957 RepID=A0A813E0J8_POLGL|nr:unnamed protein product [Polarella glacialis]